MFIFGSCVLIVLDIFSGSKELSALVVILFSKLEQLVLTTNNLIVFFVLVSGLYQFICMCGCCRNDVLGLHNPNFPDRNQQIEIVDLRNISCDTEQKV